MTEYQRDPNSHRLAKFMARTGVASRRDCEKLILEGRVTVNGERVESPALNVLDSDVILLDGQKLAKPPLRMWLYHKPAGLVTTSRDEKDRKTIFDELPPVLRNVNTVGRLDLNSEGLLLLTNDGELKRKLELPDTGWRRKYRVRAYGKATEEQLDTLRKGIVIDGEVFRPMEITLDRENTDNKWYTVALREGKNREIRRAFDTIGLNVNRLIRTSYGPFQLGAMDKGEVTELRPKALRTLLGGLLPEAAVLGEVPLDIQTSHDEREAVRAEKRAEREELMKKNKAKGKGGKRSDRRVPPRDSSDDRLKRGFIDKPRDGDKGREFKPRDSRSDDRPKRSFGDKARGDFKGRDGDRKDFKPRGDGERRPFKSREDGDRKFTPRGDGPKRSYDDRPKRSFGDKPRGDNRHGDKPYGDKPRGDSSKRVEKPWADKRKSDKSGSDRPKRDFKPRQDGERKFAPKGDAPKRDVKRRDEPPKPNRFKRDVEKRAQKRDENVGNKASGKKVSPFFKKPKGEE